MNLFPGIDPILRLIFLPACLMIISLSLAHSIGGDVLEVLCTGHTGSMPRMAELLGREPMTDAVIIPTRIHGVTSVTPRTVRRYMRLYFPRSLQDLVESYDFLLLRGIDCYYFTTDQLEWMRKAIRDSGIGGLQDRSVMSSVSVYSRAWAESRTSDAFPNDADAVVEANYARHGTMEVIMNEDPSLSPIFTPYKDLLSYRVGNKGYTLMIPREGSHTYLRSSIAAYSDFAYPEPGVFPHTLGWRYGKGYTWSLMDYSGSGFWGSAINPYGMDAYFGMLMYSTGRDLPEDVVMVHKLRMDFHQYGDQKSFIYSMMSFAERFGANTNSLEMEIKEMDKEWRRSRELYLDQEYQSAGVILESILNDLSLLREKALKAKDRALMWIYIIEWLVISGTSLSAGFAIWTLMVKKRLYREVSATKLGRL